MSTNVGFGGFLNQFAGVQDPKQVELVRKITDRTRAGRIVWQTSSTDATASLGNKLFMTFVIGPYGNWSLFTVRDGDGHEFLKVDNMLFNKAALSYLASMSGRPQSVSLPETEESSALFDAVSELYLLVDRGAKGDIDKAIALVDRA